jgi:hypothetical protein
LDFHAFPICGDPSGFCDEPGYALHLEGVLLVPEASSFEMMLAGLGLLGYALRRRGNGDSAGALISC